jgi:protein SERAC1
LFLGTPHYGSGLTNWTEKLAKLIGLFKQTNPQILAELQSDYEVLARIQDAFYHMVRSTVEITCFYEELPLPGVGIVS